MAVGDVAEANPERESFELKTPPSFRASDAPSAKPEESSLDMTEGDDILEGAGNELGENEPQAQRRKRSESV